MRDIIIGGLLLPLRIYFQPTAFTDEIAALAPDLPRYYNLWQARHNFRDAAFRRSLGRIILQAIIALLWVPVLAGAFSATGYRVNWRDMAVGAVFSAALGVAVGVVGSVAFGVVFGVVCSVAGGMVFGVAFGLAKGVASGLAGGAAFGVLYGIVVGVAESMVAGIVIGTGFGIMFGLAGGLAFSVASALAVTHLQLFPLQLLLSSVGWAVTRLYPRFSSIFWPISPAQWDEIILLPLPGLVGLLVTLNRTNPTLGQETIAEVAAHNFQYRAARKALVRLAQEEAVLVTSLPALAAFAQSLDWVSYETEFFTSLNTLLPRMRDISREVASALESDSATNRVRRLTAAKNMLESLQKQPGEFGAALTRWSPIIATGLEEAQQQKRIQEPIPQVYIKDGTPIRLADRPDTALPFKGRAALFRQLETALGGKEGERTTFALYGQRRTGKTSALLQLPRRLGSQMVPAFLDLQSEKLGGANNIAGLLGGLAEEVREEARRHRGMLLPPIDRAVLIQDPFPAFGRWLDRMEKELGERTLLLCLDEFEALEEAIGQGRFDTRILSTIRNIAQHRRSIALLLSGSHQISELPPHWASALITTTTLPVSFLEEADARELIEQPVADFPSIYTPPAVDRIIEATHCQPYLIQLMCALLVERMNAARRMPPESFVTKADVESVIPAVLARGQNYFIDLWRAQTGSKLAQQVLSALAQTSGERLSSKAVRRIEQDEMALGEAINTLLRREIIERTNSGYRVVVPLVAAYVRQEMAV